MSFFTLFLLIIGGLVLALGAIVFMNDQWRFLRASLIILGGVSNITGWILLMRW